MSRAPGLQTFYEGWANYQRLVLAAIKDLTPEQLALRTAAHQWAVWQLAGHVAGSRAYWFHDVLGEGDAATRDMFRVASTTVPDLPLEDAGWEDDEDHPRDAAQIVEAFALTGRQSMTASSDGRRRTSQSDSLASAGPAHRRSPVSGWSGT